jgi:hypothetical protein
MIFGSQTREEIPIEKREMQMIFFIPSYKWLVSNVFHYLPDRKSGMRPPGEKEYYQPETIPKNC